MCIGYKCIHKLLKNNVVPSSYILKCDVIGMKTEELHFVKAINAIIASSVQKSK